jgi:Putative flagellar system-associated repeat
MQKNTPLESVNAARQTPFSEQAEGTQQGAMHPVANGKSQTPRKKPTQPADELGGQETVVTDATELADETQTMGSSDTLAQAQISGAERPVLLAQAETAAVAAGDAAAAGATGVGAGAGTAAIASAGLSTSALVALGGLGLAAVAGGGGGAAAAAKAAAATVTGSVVDGYLSGATVFIDVDGDGVLDSNEPNAKTDSNGDFVLPAGVSGEIVAFGGTDISTGLPFKGVLKAPAGSTVVTPLTTLMADLVSSTVNADQAQTLVLRSLGLESLDASVDLTTLDPVDLAGKGDANALEIYKAGVKVATMVTNLTSKVINLASADSSKIDDVASDVFELISKKLGTDGFSDDSIDDTAATLLADAVSKGGLGGITFDNTLKTALNEFGKSYKETLSDLSNNLGEVKDLATAANNQKAAQSDDALPPKRINASIDGAGDVVTLYFDRELDEGAQPLVSQFKVLNGTAEQSISEVQVVGNRVQLKLASALDTSKAVKVSFSDDPAVNGTATVQDSDGVDAQSFANVVVSNALSLTASGAENFAHASTLSLAGAEISAFDADSNRLFVTAPAGVGLQVVQVNADLSMTLLGTVSVGSNDINSVAIKNGIVAVAVADADKTQPGKVYFLDADATTVDASMVLGNVSVGALPDMLTFSADGKTVLVANEAEQNDVDGTSPPALVNPEGSVSIIDLSAGVASASVKTAGFADFNSRAAELKAAGVRLFAGETGFESVTVAQDLEPEYISIAPDGKTAFVTLQENNAIGILDIAQGKFTDIVPLGLKSFEYLLMDASDRDGASNATKVSLQTGQPVFGQYMPDSISSFTGKDGRAYYLIANEGDDRDDFIVTDETIRVGASGYDLDNTAYPDEATLKTNAELARLTVSNAPGNRGDTDGDGDIDQILTYGARSFSILNDEGVIVFDSGSHMEQFVAQSGLFTTATGSGLLDDTRSDNKGPEPEGVSIGKVGDRTLAFVGMERGGGGVMVYDVTNPKEVSFVQYLRKSGDASPEGLSFVSQADSPSGRDLLFVTNEVSNTVSVFQSGSDLDVGDVMFVGANTDATDGFAFMLLDDVASGTQIGFTDRAYDSVSGFGSLTDEMALLWTADRSYQAGTVVNVQTGTLDAKGNASVDKGHVIGSVDGLSDTGEVLFAFKGEIANLFDGQAGTIGLDGLLAALAVGGAATPGVSAIASTTMAFAQDNAKYTGAAEADNASAMLALLGNTANWSTSDTTAFNLAHVSTIL